MREAEGAGVVSTILISRCMLLEEMKDVLVVVVVVAAAAMVMVAVVAVVEVQVVMMKEVEVVLVMEIVEIPKRVTVVEVEEEEEEEVNEKKMKGTRRAIAKISFEHSPTFHVISSAPAALLHYLPSFFYWFHEKYLSRLSER